MSAIKLLEQLGANASLQNVEAAKSMMAGSSLNEIEHTQEKMWCLLVPAEDDEKEDEEKEQEPDNNEIKLN